MSEGARRPRRRLSRWLWRGVAVVAVLAVVAAVGLGWWLHRRLSASLPPLAGELTIAGLAAPVTIERDRLGVPTITGGDRLDVAFATGFVHGQDRFFQMDLLRRQAAGELAELVGEPVLRLDRSLRPHRFRARAGRVLAAAPAHERRLLESYARGVEAGRASLAAAPPEYLALGAEPAPWTAEDSVLAQFAMYLMLQDEDGEYEGIVGCLHERLPAPLATFLTPVGTSWDAALDGSTVAQPPVPAPPGLAPLSTEVAPPGAADAGRPALLPSQAERGASNAWAIAGSRTADGRALLAADMHVGLSVPNLWYRVALVWPAAGGGEHRVVGVTVPGLPLVLAGSNGRLAWAFTNPGVDTTDVVTLDSASDGAGDYQGSGGPARFERFAEAYAVRGGEEIREEVLWTEWGPVLGEDHAGRRFAVRWAAHDEGAVDLSLGGLETARDVEQALAIGAAAGMPALNLVVADGAGRIGWTLAGRVPRRQGFDGRLPGSWAAGERSWHGWLSPAELPRSLDPATGYLWSANNRTVGGESLARVGDGNYVLGARARQIRERLAELDAATVEDMRALQLDDRALFLVRWQELLVDTLDASALEEDPRRRALRRHAEEWAGRAVPGSVGYRVVREFRDRVAERAFAPLTQPCAQAPEFDYVGELEQLEGPLWRLIEERPPHLLAQDVEDWRTLLLASADAVIAAAEDGDDGPGGEPGPGLDAWTWGERNRAGVRHLFSRAVPIASRWLDMPDEPLPGDERMPRVQRPGYGASQRMALAPGAEEGGYFHMPAGQSGHPLSPHYDDSHAAWASGEATPFLPGEPVHRLVLRPAVEAP